MQHPSIAPKTPDKTFACPICGKEFARYKYLYNHKVRHTSVKRFACGTCGKSFHQKVHMKNHERQHTGEKPYVCDVCNNAFARNDTYLLHRRTHTGEKPYKCDVCETRFTQLAHLKTHLRAHTGEKPNKCEECESSFYDRLALKRHMINAHGQMQSHEQQDPRKCTECLANFTNRVALARHMESDHGKVINRPNKCSQCLSSFYDRISLKRHQINEHGKVFPSNHIKTDEGNEKDREIEQKCKTKIKSESAIKAAEQLARPNQIIRVHKPKIQQHKEKQSTNLRQPEITTEENQPSSTYKIQIPPQPLNDQQQLQHHDQPVDTLLEDSSAHHCPIININNQNKINHHEIYVDNQSDMLQMPQYNMQPQVPQYTSYLPQYTASENVAQIPDYNNQLLIKQCSNPDQTMQQEFVISDPIPIPTYQSMHASYTVDVQQPQIQLKIQKPKSKPQLPRQPRKPKGPRAKCNKCDRCDAAFYDRYALKRHMIKEHDEIFDKTITRSSPPTREQAAITRKIISHAAKQQSAVDVTTLTTTISEQIQLHDFETQQNDFVMETLVSNHDEDNYTSSNNFLSSLLGPFHNYNNIQNENR